MPKEKISSYQFSDPQDECGVTAIFSKSRTHVSPEIPRMQHRLQHRGRDSAGMASYNHELGKLVVYKNNGSVQHVFGGVVDRSVDEFSTTFNFAQHNLLSDVAIGHNRYGTSGDVNKDSVLGAQPMMMEWEGRSLALAFNGNIPQFERAILKGTIPSEMPKLPNFDTNDLLQAIIGAEGYVFEERLEHALHHVRKAFSINMLTGDGELFGLRSSSGTWPLWVGESSEKIVFASETRVDSSDEYEWSMVKAGELVKATPSGVERTQLFPPAERVMRCTLHDFYMARQDSLMTEELTYGDFRIEGGRTHAEEHPMLPDEVQVVTGVPSTALGMAVGMGEVYGVAATEIFSVPADAERSYISKDQKEVDKILDSKHRLDHPDLVRGKNVVATDDSLIKSSTIVRINRMLREAGAASIHNRIVVPKVIKPCELGVYMEEPRLAAIALDGDDYRVRENEEIAQLVGADSIEYTSIEGIEKLYDDQFHGEEYPCTGCMVREVYARRQTEYDTSEIRVFQTDDFIDNGLEVARMITVGVS